jgi:predicted permease
MLTLAIGIGGNTATFSAIKAVLLKPLGYHDPDRLVRVAVDFPGRPRAASFTPIRLDQMRRARSVEEMGSFLVAPLSMTLTGGTEPEAIKSARVSSNFLHILGVEPALGRGFLPQEDRPEGPPVVLISSELWQRRFGSDPMITGKTANIDSSAYTIVGVLPPRFQFPFAGVDVWFPKAYAAPTAPAIWPTIPTLIGFARLKAGASMEQSRAEMDVLSHQYALAHPELGDADPNSRVRITRMRDQLVGDVRTTLWLLFGAVGLVLLITCANVASLLLARAASRSREFAVRVAVGAGRGRLLRQLLAESILLAAAGGVAGVVLAHWGVSFIRQIDPSKLPRAAEIRLDPIVLGFALAVSIATAMLFGLLPSLRASRPDVGDLLRAQGAATAARRGRVGFSARGLLVIAQVAMSTILLISAALLLETVARLRRVDPGFQPANLLTMHISLPRSRYDPSKWRPFWEELVRRTGALPGVRRATVAQTLPLTVRYAIPMALAELPPVKIGERPLAQYVSIMPAYFRTLGIPLRRGREFNDGDTRGNRRPVLIIDESLARRFWPQYPAGEDPIGQHVLFGAPQGRDNQYEIVGIVASVRESGLANDAQPEIYLPMAQTPVPMADLAVKTEGDPLRLANAVRGQVLAIDRDQPVSAIRTMEEIVETSIGQQRAAMLLLGSFAGMAWLLAMIGIYGVIAYSVAQRTQEVGIRRALGAQEDDILRLVIAQGLG